MKTKNFWATLVVIAGFCYDQENEGSFCCRPAVGTTTRRVGRAIIGWTPGWGGWGRGWAEQQAWK